MLSSTSYNITPVFVRAGRNRLEICWRKICETLAHTLTLPYAPCQECGHCLSISTGLLHAANSCVTRALVQWLKAYMPAESLRSASFKSETLARLPPCSGCSWPNGVKFYSVFQISRTCVSLCEIIVGLLRQACTTPASVVLKDLWFQLSKV